MNARRTTALCCRGHTAAKLMRTMHRPRGVEIPLINLAARAVFLPCACLPVYADTLESLSPEKVKVDAAYVEANTLIVREQLQKVDVRLAPLLDARLGK
jgi:hypothetical protein